MTNQPTRPPLPTPEAIAAAPIRSPGPALQRFVQQLQPGRFDLTAGLCVGKAPNFDADRFKGETDEEHEARLEWAQHQCDVCPVALECTIGAPVNATGVIAGEVRATLPKRRRGAA